MSPRSFFRLLQPTHTVPFVLFFTGLALASGRGLFQLAWPREALFVTCAVTLPLLAGAALTGLLHAVLHRPHALLLPDLLPRLRRTAAFAYLALAALVTLTCTLIEPAAPAVAVFGLALGLLTLSCANRRLGFPQLKQPGLIPGSLTVATAWLLLHLRFAHDLLPALTTAPGAFLAAGIALAATTFSLGFTRRTLRQRATTPYFASAYNWAAFLDPSAHRRQLQEQTQFNASRGIGQKSRLGRDWPLRSVGPHLRDWLRVFDHQQVLSSPWRWATMCAATGLSLLGGLSVVASFEAHGASFALRLLSTLAGLTAESGQLDTLARIGTTQVGITLFIPFLISHNLSRPVLTYPLSRERLAGIVFAHVCRHFAIALTMAMLGFWLCSVIGQAALHRFNPLLGLRPVATIAVVLVPFLALFAWTGFLGSAASKRPGAHALGFVVYLAAIVFLLFARVDWSDVVLSVPGILVSALAATAALALLRRRIRAFYRTCDLTVETARSTPFGVQKPAGG